MDDADLDVILETARDLVRKRVIPHEAEIDATDEMPAGLREEAARMGLFGFAIPEEYGGLGLSMAQPCHYPGGIRVLAVEFARHRKDLLVHELAHRAEDFPL
jgi:hypothetical protein